MRNECRIIESKLQFFLDKGKPLSDVFHKLHTLKTATEQTSRNTEMNQRIQKINEEISITNHNLDSFSKSTNNKLTEYGTELTIQRYDTDDNLIRIQKLEKLHLALKPTLKPDASRWELDLFTLQSKFETLHKSVTATQQSTIPTTSLKYRIKKLEEITCDTLGNQSLQHCIHNLETTLTTNWKSHADELAKLHHKLNTFPNTNQEVKHESSLPQLVQQFAKPPDHEQNFKSHQHKPPDDDHKPDHTTSHPIH